MRARSIRIAQVLAFAMAATMAFAGCTTNREDDPPDSHTGETDDRPIPDNQTPDDETDGNDDILGGEPSNGAGAGSNDGGGGGLY